MIDAQAARDLWVAAPVATLFLVIIWLSKRG